jgi:hypothetical protein
MGLGEMMDEVCFNDEALEDGPLEGDEYAYAVVVVVVVVVKYCDDTAVEAVVVVVAVVLDVDGDNEQVGLEL